MPSPAAPDASGAARRPRWWPLAVIFGIQGALILAFYGLAGRFAPPAKLLAYDVLALPGEEVELLVEVDQDLPPLLRSRLEGLQLEVESAGGGFPAATGATGDGGRGRVRLRAPQEEGVYDLRVRASPAGSGSGSDLAAVARLQVLAAERPLVLSTVRRALSTVVHTLPAEAEGPEASRSELRPDPDASRVLGDLAREHAVVYIEFLPRRDLETARVWLAANGFPEGAVLVPPGYDPRAPESLAPRLIEFIRSAIRPRWNKVRWAFSSGEAETRGFARSGIPTVHIGTAPESVRELPHVRKAKDWVEARGIVE